MYFVEASSGDYRLVFRALAPPPALDLLLDAPPLLLLVLAPLDAVLLLSEIMERTQRNPM